MKGLYINSLLIIRVIQRRFRNISLLLFMLSLNIHLPAQDIESLEKLLGSDTLSETNRIEILNQLSLFMSLVNEERALEAANEAISLSNKANYKRGLANAYRNLSILYFYYDESYYMSMEYLQRALDIFKELNDSTGIGNCYISLGHTYRNLHEGPKEIEYHKKAYDIFLRLKIPERIGVASLNLGESYLINGELEKSRPFLEFAIGLNDSIRKFTTLSTCYKALGNLEFSQGNYLKAESDFLKVVQISEDLGSNFQKLTTIESLIQLAEIYKIKGDHSSQIEYLIKAAEFSRNNDLINYLLKIYTELIQYYTSKGDNTSIQKYVTEYRTVSDSMNTRQLKDRNRQINSIIQIHDLEKDKTQLEQAALMQKERNKIRNLILIAVLVSFSMLAWFMVKIYRTNKKITEANLILSNQQQIIENQRKHLEELNNTKDKFFSIVAHDLRSPLVSLKSFSDLLIDGVDHFTKDEITQMGNQLQLSVDNTIKMTDNLLTWARVQMREYDIKPVNSILIEIVNEISDFYKEIASKKEVEFICNVDTDLSVFGDRNQIAFVIRNLVNNAVKFTDRGGTVSLTAMQLPDNKTEIIVSDNGIGISQEMKDTIFFVGKKQSATGTAGEKGTGLGLILSYDFIKMNNGTVEYESEKGKGTIFKVVFNSKET